MLLEYVVSKEICGFQYFVFNQKIPLLWNRAKYHITLATERVLLDYEIVQILCI